MTLDNFENFIDPKILERGKDYYFNDSVINIEKITPEKWKAQVEGSELYNVEAKLNGKEIIDSYCDCPYDFGPYCKHQVAFFYSLQDQDIRGNSKNNSNKQNNLKFSKSERLDRILLKIDKNDLIKFIKEKALSDDLLYTSIVSTFGLDNECIEKSEYYNIIKSHLNQAKDRHGFIDYYQASHSVEGAEMILNQARNAFDINNYPLTIAMAQSVVEIMIPAIQEVDDSDGFFGTIIDEAFDMLFECSQSDLNEKTRKDFFEYSLNEMNKKKYDGWAQWQFNFLEIAKNLSKDKNELCKIIKIIDNFVNKKSSYYYEELLFLKYEILIKSGDLEEAGKFFQNNLHLPSFRKVAIENAFNEKNYKKAEELAFEGERINKDLRGLVKDWKGYRLRIYEETKNIDKQRDLLIEFALEEDLDSYLKLKKTYNKTEWQNIFLEIINKIKKKYTNYISEFLIDIYIEENLIVDLLNEIKKEPSYIVEYDKILLKDFSSDVYDLYKKHIMVKIRCADSRSDYQESCKIIRRLIKIGGNNTAYEIINYIKEEYKKRPAFMDELSKIKI